MHTDILLQKIAPVEKLAQASKLQRLLHHPIKYAFAIFYKSIVYPIKQKETQVSCSLFTGRKIEVLLPAATDIYLLGGKSHISELNLAKFLILNVKEGNVFWDIGAHYGYFSLIASELVGSAGKVISIEAAPKTFKMLLQNTKDLTNTKALNFAVSDKDEKIVFHEFPNQYSEYNSTDVKQFEDEAWFKNTSVNRVEIDGIKLSTLQEHSPLPQFIKIDVEGGEFDVIKSGIEMLHNNSVTIIMEYLEPKRNNGPHVAASQLLIEAGYKANIIKSDGQIAPINDIDGYLTAHHLESDNIVFKK